MLTAATLGMFLYGIYSVATGVIDLLGPVSLDIWADIMLIFLGGWLIIASVSYTHLTLPTSDLV